MKHRIPPVSDHKKASLAALFRKAESRMGFLPHDGLIMAHKPEVLTAFFELLKAIYAEGKINGGLKRMIGHIASKAAGCTYCSAHTAYGAHRQGVDTEKLEALWTFETSSLFSKAEKAALNVALKASITPSPLTDDDFESLKTYYDDEAIVEMVSVIAMFGFLNRWNIAFHTPLEYAPGMFYESLNQKK